MNKPKAVVLDGYTLNSTHDLSWEPLESICDISIYEKTLPHETVSRCKGCSIVFTNKVLITSEVIDSLPELKYVGVIATGYNVVDIEYAKKKGIVVTNVPSYGSESVAQLAFSFILEFCFHVGAHSEEVHQGKWSQCEHFCYRSFPLYELHGKTLGIFGMGNIGRALMRMAYGFGMKVLFTNRSQKTIPEFPEAKQVDFETLVSQSDFISLNAPLTEETRELVNEKTLRLFKKGSYIINTARGALINEQAVAEALKAGTLAGYATDVLSAEPPAPNNPLFGLENCLITPHMAWQTFEARSRLLSILADNAKAFIEGRVQNRVN